MRTKIYFGGMFFVKRISTPEFLLNQGLAAHLFSISDCFCELLPSAWTISGSVSDKTKEIATKSFELSENDQKNLSEECTRLFEENKIGWPNVIADLETAKGIKRWTSKVSDQVKLLMIGVNAEDREAFIDSEKEYRQESGIVQCLLKGDEVLPNGKLLGHEILGSDYGSFHTWYCNNINKDASEKFGINPNPLGFIKKYSDAKKICEMINKDDYKAEPVKWIPWKVYEVEL